MSNSSQYYQITRESELILVIIFKDILSMVEAISPVPEETKEATDEPEWWIGIDLGTTFTAAALWRDQRVNML